MSGIHSAFDKLKHFRQHVRRHQLLQYSPPISDDYKWEDKLVNVLLLLENNCTMKELLAQTSHITPALSMWYDDDERNGDNSLLSTADGDTTFHATHHITAWG